MRTTLAVTVVVAIVIAELASACDIIVHVKSATDKKFKAQVRAPNGKNSDKWSFEQNRQQETFQQKASECSLGQWTIETFNENGTSAKSVQVTLNGIGRVLYTVNDNLELTQVERQGAICTGQCAPLGTTASKSNSRPASPSGQKN
ncbi:hypothetical protein M3Y94_00253200 [Aphelenchoides besseyi]|nr:hypothetical protein M3Y94_00253200 [Aphelenchoides besseyi]